MAFDAGMTAAVCAELSEALVGAKIEKVYQPTADEIVLLCRGRGGSRKLLLSASASSARVCMTEISRENPKTPPMFCMQLRKHLTGAVIQAFRMYGFERVIEAELSAFDEMGFPCKKFLHTEIMGKYSNLIFTEEKDGEKRVLGALKPVDFTTSSKRQVLAGMAYELPPAQDKTNPLTENASHFEAAVSSYPQGRTAEKFILDTFQGVSPLIAREIAHKAGVLGKTIEEIPRTDVLWRALKAFCESISEKAFTPVMLCHENGTPFEYAFCPIRQYGTAAQIKQFPSFSAMFDEFFGARERAAAMRSRMRDMESVLNHAKNKLSRKIPQLKKELLECEEMETFKLWGDLITASIYMLRKKAAFCEVTNYYSEEMETVRIPLDNKLTPSQNAARYYKKYTKLKTARSILKEQIEKAEEELAYLLTVEASMPLAENEDDILGIRSELAHAGYISKNPAASKQKEKPERGIRKCRTALGREFFVGKNNMQNDYLTTKLARKSDWWFHVKGAHGSHVVMVCEPGEDPDARDFTEAAAAAAYYSELRESENVAVDYTEVRNVKKPSGSVPGKAVYYTNYTAYVNPAKPNAAD